MSEHPLPTPLARPQVEAILYLADRMAFTDLKISPSERTAIHALAEHAGEPEFREEVWYERLSDDQACHRLNTEAARTGALVVLRYIVRCDSQVDAAEYEYFQQLMERLDVPSVQIPKDLDHHRRLALAYLK